MDVPEVDGHLLEAAAEPAAAQIHANADAVKFFARLVAAKSAGDRDTALAFVSADAAVFADVPLGWELNGHAAIREAWGRHIPSWGPGQFNLDAVLGEIRSGWGSVMLIMTNTLPAFRAHMQVSSAVDVRNGKITRWIDYWDGACLDADLYKALKSPRPGQPQASRSGTSCVARRVSEVAARLVDLLSRGEALAAGRLFTVDGCFEEHGIGAKLCGRAAISRYLSRVVGALPLGRRASLGHIVGGERGGGFEWLGSPESPVATGAAALRLNRDGLISHVSVTYDTRDLPDSYRHVLRDQATDLLH